MKIPGLKTARAISSRLQARIFGGALILGYHRVAQPSRDPYEVCVSQENFGQHLEILHKYTRPMTLSQLVKGLKDGASLPRSVAVTFDDGYSDNLYDARPLLEKYEVPATVFICTGYAGREFWWDELDRLVMSSSAQLDTLRLEVRERCFKWDPPAGRRDTKLPDKEQRAQFHHELYHFLLEFDVHELEEALELIRDWASVESNKKAPSRALDHDELLKLGQGELMELGAHTQNHLMLPNLSLERQRDEIVSSKSTLEAVLNRPVYGFAYPNGRSTKHTKWIVREAGFAYACTSLENVVRSASDLHELTRFWQKDVGGESFMRGLNQWMRMQV